MNHVHSVMPAKGFSLIELLVVVGIIAIIGAIAYPGYQGYIRDTYHAQARADVRLCALALDRFYAEGFTYAGGEAECRLWSPSEGPAADRRYTLSLPVVDVGTYTIRATPVDGACAGRCYELDADGAERAL